MEAEGHGGWGMVAEAAEWADASRQRVSLRVWIWYAYAYVPPYPGRRHRGLVAAIGDNPVYFGTAFHVEEQFTGHRLAMLQIRQQVYKPIYRLL